MWPIQTWTGTKEIEPNVESISRGHIVGTGAEQFFCFTQLHGPACQRRRAHGAMSWQCCFGTEFRATQMQEGKGPLYFLFHVSAVTWNNTKWRLSRPTAEKAHFYFPTNSVQNPSSRLMPSLVWLSKILAKTFQLRYRHVAMLVVSHHARLLVTSTSINIRSPKRNITPHSKKRGVEMVS